MEGIPHDDYAAGGVCGESIEEDLFERERRRMRKSRRGW
jgi:hypothetical protein